VSEPYTIRVDLLDESAEFSLPELCRMCAVERQLVLEIVAEGIVEPSGEAPDAWRFSGIAVARVQRVIRLQQDFEVNLAGAALALELLEEIERLKRLHRP
jgi:chaperone modulatory protein CbpM